MGVRQTASSFSLRVPTEAAPRVAAGPVVGPVGRDRQGERMSRAWLEALALGCLVAAGLWVRLWVLRVQDELNADEVLPGLMALHIASGGEAPVFFYGQHYFGALEAYLTAGLFRVWGFQPWLVVAVPLTASLALIPVTWGLAAQLAGRPAGLLAAVLVAIPPPVMAKLFVNSGGGFSLAFMLQGAALLCFLRAYSAEHGRARWGAAFSLCAGFLCWVWQPALALYPVLLALLVFRWPQAGRPPAGPTVSGSTVFRALARLVGMVAPVFLGLAPPLLYNLQHGWPTIHQLSGKYVTPGGEAAGSLGAGAGLSAISGLLVLALGGGNEAEGGANFFQAALVSLAFPLTLVLLTQAARRAPGDVVWRRRRATAQVLALVALVAVLAAHNTVRHLVPVALIGYAFTGATLTLLADRLRYGHLLGLIAAGTLVVAPNIWLDLHSRRIFQRFVAGAGEVQEAVGALQERGLRTGYSDYWSAYPVTYFAGERIIVAPEVPAAWVGRVDRYPPYTQQVHAVTEPRQLFLLLDDGCAPLPYLLPLEQAGATYQLEHLGRWYLVWDIRPPLENTATLLTAWREVIASRTAC